MAASISSRLIALLTLCAVVTLGAGILLDYRLSRDEILQRLELESRDTIQGMLGDLENLLDGVQDSTLFLGRILQQRDYSREGLTQLVRELVDWNSDVFGATIALNPELEPYRDGFAPYFYQHNGTLTAVDLNAGAEPYWQQDWYRQAADSGQPVWVEPYFDEYGAQVLMTTFSVPVFRVDEQGQRYLYAVVTADIPLQELHDYLQRLRMGQYSRSLLLSNAGTILSARDPELIMRHYSDLITDGPRSNVIAGMIERARGGENGTAEIPCPWTSGNCRVEVGSLPGPRWPVGVIYSEQEMLAPLRDYGIKAALIGLATVLVMVLAVALVTRRLTKPLKSLAAASGAIAQGQLNTPLPRSGRPDEVGRLVDSFKAMTRDLRSYIDDLEQATQTRSRLEGELAAARQIQMSMLPGSGDAREQGPGYQLAAKVRPAKSVGGDLYHIRRFGDSLLLAVGDVSDKGVPAALFMARAMSQLQSLDQKLDPARAMAQLNDALAAGNENCMFVTLFLGCLDLRSGELLFASAGHPAPLLLRGGEVRELPQDMGPAIGLVAGLEFHNSPAQLSEGDRLVIYTDGIDEAFNEQREMFSQQGLIDALVVGAAQTAGPALEGVLDTVDDFAAGHPQSDDITLLLLDFAARQQFEQYSFAPGEAVVSRALEWLAGARIPQLLPESSRFELALLLEESLANIDHYAGLSTEQRIEVRLGADERVISLQVSDPGSAFNPLTDARGAELGLPSDRAAVGGLGVHLIRQLSDNQYYRREGGRNILTLEISRNAQGN